MTEKVLKAPLPEPVDAASHVVASAGSRPHTARPASTEFMTYIAAVNTALREALEGDPATVVYGEDVGKAGGIFGAARYLQRDFGETRVFDTPIAENAILGSAVGAALGGLKPIVEIMWADFVSRRHRPADQPGGQYPLRHAGRSSVPMVVRMQQGRRPAHARSIRSRSKPCLPIFPASKSRSRPTPQDAYSLLRSAAADPDPCVVIGPLALSDAGEVTLGGAPEAVGKARLCRQGGDA